jgi:hypothetical protein
MSGLPSAVEGDDHLAMDVPGALQLDCGTGLTYYPSISTYRAQGGLPQDPGHAA